MLRTRLSWRTNLNVIGRCLSIKNSHEYNQEYSKSLTDRVNFWADRAKDIHWDKFPSSILDDSNKPFYKWYKGGKMNTCYNAIDRHVNEGFGDEEALVYVSPLAKTTKSFTYNQLLDKVSKFAGMLASKGVGKGDRVIIFMPMIPEAVISMLACARLGAVHSVVFGGFAGKELSVRIDDSKPKVVITASCGIEPTRILPYKPLVDTAFELANHKPDYCILLQREQHQAENMIKGRDFTFDEALKDAKPHPCVSVDATDPLYVLYTSGTTGAPKGVLRDNGGHAVALKYSMKTIFDMKAGDTFMACSDIGWVVGHSYIVYAPLINRTRSILYEGKPIGTPDAGAYFKMIQDYKVNSMFTAPTALRAIRRDDSSGAMIEKYDTTSLRTMFVAGERADPDTLKHFQTKLKIPIIDHWWQTETGWPMCSLSVGLGMTHTKFGSAGFPVPGWDIKIVDETTHKEVHKGEGQIVVKLPLPPGALPTLYNNDKRFKESYLEEFPGYFKTGDAGMFDDEGYLHIMARVDDVINVSGHRLLTGAIEEVLMRHNSVAECAVVGAANSLKGQIPIGLVVLSKVGDKANKEDVIKELVAGVRKDIGPVADFKNVVFVTQLPKTRSGKILRNIMRAIADQRPYVLPGTIENVESVDIVKNALASFLEEKN